MNSCILKRGEGGVVVYNILIPKENTIQLCLNSLIFQHCLCINVRFLFILMDIVHWFDIQLLVCFTQLITRGTGKRHDIAGALLLRFLRYTPAKPHCPTPSYSWLLWGWPSTFSQTRPLPFPVAINFSWKLPVYARTVSCSAGVPYLGPSVMTWARLVTKSG